MRTKHFISDQSVLVDGLCRSLLAQHGALRYDNVNKVVFLPRKNREDDRVKLISGGGSGHEPAHAGYVGNGMLDAAVCGAVFASPNVDQIVTGLDHIDSPQGILAIVKNYTGDKLNFALAIEEFRAKARTPVEMVLIGDDVAVPRSRGKAVGRRGLAGTVLVHKAAGAAAQRKISLKKTATIAQYVADNLATVGVSLDHCSVPGSTEVVSLAKNEVELGMGIHNEPGVQLICPQPDIGSLVDSMLKFILDTQDSERAYVPTPQTGNFVLLINNLGGLSVLELSAIANVVLQRLRDVYGLQPARIYVGSYLTSLDGPGFSVTILNLGRGVEGCAPQDILQLLDDPTDAVAWTANSKALHAIDSAEQRVVSAKPPTLVNGEHTSAVPYNVAFFDRVLQDIHKSVIQWEPRMTKFDTLMGDGDCGTTLLAGSEAALAANATATNSLVQAMLTVAGIARKAMGGTSGALYGLFLGALATAIQDEHTVGRKPMAETIASAAASALATLERFTSAREGSRTLMDALIPAIASLQKSSGESSANMIGEALENARRGMEATRSMSSTFGRSSYVGTGSIDSDGQDPTAGIPDPGACGIVAIFEGIQAAIAE